MGNFFSFPLFRIPFLSWFPSLCFTKTLQQTPQNDTPPNPNSYQYQDLMPPKTLDQNEYSRLFFRGFVAVKTVNDANVIVAAAFGVAICNARDNVVFEVNKGLVVDNKTCKRGVEAEALVEGLNAALGLGLKRVIFFCRDFRLYQYVTGSLQPKRSKTISLVNQVTLLQRKFTYCQASLVARNNVKSAFKLARDAILSQITLPAETSRGKNLKETCLICFEDIDVSQMFSVDSCLHMYCFCCMKRHVEVKLHHGIVVKCPHDGCKSEVNIDSCGKLLEPELIEMVRERIKEATIPVTEKFYCPYPRCSALMSKSDILESKNIFDAKQSRARKCTKCCRSFCINCKVPWHNKMTCNEYKSSKSYLLEEDAELNSLARTKLWRQCVHCNHMVELAEGCYHITCRCGYEFCYTCGAQYKNNKAKCSCPLWDERFIVRENILGWE